MKTHLSNEELALETARKLRMTSHIPERDGVDIHNTRVILAALESLNPSPREAK